MAKDSNKKQSFIMGSLTSSAGVFISKAIGLFYVVPFTALATEANMAFYSAAFTYYSIILQVCTAGLPFATAAVVAKYASNNDYKSVMKTRRISIIVLMASGFVMGLLFMLVSKPLSVSILGASATETDIHKMRITFLILGIALFIVPLLSSYRGFYQGLKDLKVYADSQVIEQFGRVISLLLLGFVCVRIFNLDNIFAVYMAVGATSIGAILAILYYRNYDRRHIGPLLREARYQEEDAEDGKVLLKELAVFGLPYLLGSIVGNSQALINTNFFITVSTGLGMAYEEAKLIYGIIEVQCNKLTSIPQVLGVGFSAGIVPYMTIALESNNMVQLRKNIRDCLDTVLFIAVPVCFCMIFLARPIYFIMYGNANLDLGENCLAWSGLLALVTTITPICSSMMMTLHFRKESIIYLCVGFAIKCITFYPLIKYTGYIGAITSSILCSLSIIYLDLTKLKNKFGITYALTLVRLIKMLICCCAMNAVFAIFKMVGFGISETSRFMALAELAVYGIVGGGVYLYASSMMKLPQAILHKSLKSIFRGVLGRKRA